MNHHLAAPVNIYLCIYLGWDIRLGWCSSALDKCTNCFGVTQMVPWLVTLSPWSEWWAKVEWNGPHVVHDQMTAGVRCVSLYVSLQELWTTVSVRSFCWDNRFDSNQCPTESINPYLFGKTHTNTHTHTHTQASTWDALEVLNSCLFRAGFSPSGESWTEPKRKTREESPSLLWCQHPSLSFPYSVCLSLTNTLSLALFFSLFFSASSGFFFLHSLSISLWLSIGFTAAQASARAQPLSHR